MQRRRKFQSTPPSRVATRIRSSNSTDGEISIHTTLAGGDLDLSAGGDLTSDFNPHHPRGWRPTEERRILSMAIFQSTPPSRVATFRQKRTSAVSLDFNPHHPRGWRLLLRRVPPAFAGDFNPHHPRGWRPLWSPPLRTSPEFQSTPPSRVATCPASKAPLASSCISIHTTLAGGDQRFLG